jgi:bacterial/archaeal transporter family-2 protein
LDSTELSGFVGYFIGVVCMAALAVLLQDPLPSAVAAARIPWWSWSGGLFGAIFIGLAILLIPKLGSATFFALLVAGQMLGSLMFDHFGLLGIPVHSVTWFEWLALRLIVGGVLLNRM